VFKPNGCTIVEIPVVDGSGNTVVPGSGIVVDWNGIDTVGWNGTVGFRWDGIVGVRWNGIVVVGWNFWIVGKGSTKDCSSHKPKFTEELLRDDEHKGKEAGESVEIAESWKEKGGGGGEQEEEHRSQSEEEYKLEEIGGDIEGE
jgi:hypothetical protein